MTFMDESELKNILESYNWIKVKKYDPKDGEFEQHHIEETEFLIKKCREIAQCLLDLQDTHSTLLVALDYNRRERDELKELLKKYEKTIN